MSVLSIHSRLKNKHVHSIKIRLKKRSFDEPFITQSSRITALENTQELVRENTRAHRTSLHFNSPRNYTNITYKSLVPEVMGKFPMNSIIRKKKQFKKEKKIRIVPRVLSISLDSPPSIWLVSLVSPNF